MEVGREGGGQGVVWAMRFGSTLFALTFPPLSSTSVGCLLAGETDGMGWDAGGGKVWVTNVLLASKRRKMVVVLSKRCPAFSLLAVEE